MYSMSSKSNSVTKKEDSDIQDTEKPVSYFGLVSFFF